MDGHRILLSGEYWHRDFRDVIAQLQSATTLVPPSQLASFASDLPSSCCDCNFDLIVLAQARRNVIDAALIDHLQLLFPSTPIVALLGSWCEGETRSGRPFPGALRVYWHQWQGRYERFVTCLHNEGLTSWHLPRTAKESDRMIDALERDKWTCNHAHLIGVAAWSQAQLEMLESAVNGFGWESLRLTSNGNRPSELRPDAICVDGHSLSRDLIERLSRLHNDFENVPVVLLLNFPRIEEIQTARELEVVEVLSKPFDLMDLRSVIERAIIVKKTESATP